MSFSKSFIRGLIADITDDQVRALIDEHMESVTALQHERDSYKTDAEKYTDAKATIASMQKELDAFKVDGTDYKVMYEKLKTDTENAALVAQKTDAYKTLLKSAGVSDANMAYVLDTKTADKAISEIVLENGKVKDEAKVLDAIKAEHAKFITVTTTTGAKVETPHNTHGTSTVTAEEFAKMGYASRLKFKRDNPDAYAEMVK